MPEKNSVTRKWTLLPYPSFHSSYVDGLGVGSIIHCRAALGTHHIAACVHGASWSCTLSSLQGYLQWPYKHSLVVICGLPNTLGLPEGY